MRGRELERCATDPFEEEYVAVRGDGAQMNGSRIRVSDTTGLGESLLATGFPYNRRDVLDELLAQLRCGLLHTRGVRRCGSAAYDLCMLARGSLDGYYERGLHPCGIRRRAH